MPTYLDEATSALDLKNEAHLYRQLKGIVTMFVSVGHRSSLVKYHQQVLELDGNSGWQLFPVQTYIERERNDRSEDIFNDGFSNV